LVSSSFGAMSRIHGTMSSFGIRPENTDPPDFFRDRNASRFSIVPAKSFHAQASAFGAGLS
jgi:hypothetical protein